MTAVITASNLTDTILRDLFFFPSHSIYQARIWGVPARHGDIPNAYVKADKEEHEEIYLRIPRGVMILEEDMQKLVRIRIARLHCG